jgi:hypothetical protein
MTEHLWLLVYGIPSLAAGTAWTAKRQYFNPSQYLAGLGCSAVKTTPSLCVHHPSYAVENRVVMTNLAVQ